jgi:galactose mutarotase-like enzyme
MIHEDSLGGFRRITLSADDLEVSVLPELGGKIQALRKAGHERNALLEPPERPYRRAPRGAAFEEFDTSGFDECFPTVAACASPDEPGVTLPDHGELWTAPWTCEREGDALRMEAQLEGRPWRFARRMSIQQGALRLEYEVISLADRPLRYLWSAHPLLAVSPGSRIILPDGVRSMVVESSRGERVGPRGAEIPWPGDGSDRLDVLAGPERGWAEKLFTEGLNEGFCELHDAHSDVSVSFRFDPQTMPYVGLWICQGGWPESRASRHFTVALEPCSGRPDSLAEAVSRGECATLAPRGVNRWILEVEMKAQPKMEKRRIRLGDGRSMIFYTFPPTARSAPAPAPDDV